MITALLWVLVVCWTAAALGALFPQDRTRRPQTEWEKIQAQMDRDAHWAKVDRRNQDD